MEEALDMLRMRRRYRVRNSKRVAIEAKMNGETKALNSVLQLAIACSRSSREDFERCGVEK